MLNINKEFPALSSFHSKVPSEQIASPHSYSDILKKSKNNVFTAPTYNQTIKDTQTISNVSAKTHCLDSPHPRSFQFGKDGNTFDNDAQNSTYRKRQTDNQQKCTGIATEYSRDDIKSEKTKQKISAKGNTHIGEKDMFSKRSHEHFTVTPKYIGNQKASLAVRNVSEERFKTRDNSETVNLKMQHRHFKPEVRHINKNTQFDEQNSARFNKERRHENASDKDEGLSNNTRDNGNGNLKKQHVPMKAKAIHVNQNTHFDEHNSVRFSIDQYCHENKGNDEGVQNDTPMTNNEKVTNQGLKGEISNFRRTNSSPRGIIHKPATSCKPRSFCVSDESINYRQEKFKSKPNHYLLKSDKLQSSTTSTALQNSLQESMLPMPKKKKQRPSKMKRRAALQSGKVLVLSSELHSRISKQMSNSNATEVRQNVELTDIENYDEYPDLAEAASVSFTKSKRYDNCHSISTQRLSKPDDDDARHNKSHIKAEEQPLVERDTHATIKIESAERPNKENANENDGIEGKVKKCPRNPVSLLDLFTSAESLAKSSRTKIDDAAVPAKTPNEKKSKAPNVLDASAPLQKRGKEREVPKQKKCTSLKKVILSEKEKKKQLLQRSVQDDSQQQDSQQLNPQQQDPQQEDANISESCCKTLAATNSPKQQLITFAEELTDSCMKSVMKSEKNILQKTDSMSVHQDYHEYKDTDCNSEILHKDHKQFINQGDIPSTYQSTNGNDLPPHSGYENKSTISNEVTGNYCDHNHLQGVPGINYPHNDDEINLSCNSDISNDLSQLSLNGINDKLKEEELLKGVQIMLHTKNFRGYCQNLLSEELNECVLSLLTDLYRFQDRIHKKDPTKTHIKRRLMYGMKEVCKHLKLKKIKCVIIAPNIEDIKAEGGLNEAVDTLIRLCKEYHSPCVFACDRRQLGRTSYKPVPVSCVGILSYDGAEDKFKKLTELLHESIDDYNGLHGIIKNNLSTNNMRYLFDAANNAPHTLIELRRRILRTIMNFRSDNSGISCNSFHEISVKYILKM